MFHESGLTRKAEINTEPLIVKKNVPKQLAVFTDKSTESEPDLEEQFSMIK
jgi:hypothetical protein